MHRHSPLRHRARRPRSASSPSFRVGASKARDSSRLRTTGQRDLWSAHNELTRVHVHATGPLGRGSAHVDGRRSKRNSRCCARPRPVHVSSPSNPNANVVPRCAEPCSKHGMIVLTALRDALQAHGTGARVHRDRRRQDQRHAVLAQWCAQGFGRHGRRAGAAPISFTGL
jgi:hypothetical protein